MMTYGTLARRSSVSNNRGCSLVRNRIATSRGATCRESIKFCTSRTTVFASAVSSLNWEIRGRRPEGRLAIRRLS